MDCDTNSAYLFLIYRYNNNNNNKKATEHQNIIVLLLLHEIKT